ncbi:MAG: forkhead-associated protein [Anaerolineae bacterium]|nr:MAG: forkhead-associated protein [Anaerolineae bacterium]
MQICPHCGWENFEGIIYCDRCGVALVNLPLATRVLSGSQGEQVRVDALGPDGVLILQVEQHDSPIMVQLRQDLILGRVTQTGDLTTYINLTPFGADEAGVSRRHARLLRDGNAVYLMDLNSTNGTRVNGEALAAGVEKRLHDGDELLLGRLKVYVYFKQ